MKADVGSVNGCFDMPPYDTRCASFPKSPTRAAVVGPDTQFNAKRILASPVISLTFLRVVLSLSISRGRT